jgi:hypothetical protein
VKGIGFFEKNLLCVIDQKEADGEEEFFILKNSLDLFWTHLQEIEHFESVSFEEKNYNKEKIGKN